MIMLKDNALEVEEESSILVTFTTVLSILVPASGERHMIYIDIPFDRIAVINPIEIDSQPVQSQKGTASCLKIELNDEPGWNYFLNAKPCQTNSITIIFDYLVDAQNIHDALAARRSVILGSVNLDQIEYHAMNPAVTTKVPDPLNPHQNGRNIEHSDGSPPDAMRLVVLASDTVTYLAGSEDDDGAASISNEGDSISFLPEETLQLEHEQDVSQMQINQALITSINNDDQIVEMPTLTQGCATGQLGLHASPNVAAKKRDPVANGASREVQRTRQMGGTQVATIPTALSQGADQTLKEINEHQMTVPKDVFGEHLPTPPSKDTAKDPERFDAAIQAGAQQHRQLRGKDDEITAEAPGDVDERAKPVSLTAGMPQPDQVIKQKPLTTRATEPVQTPRGYVPTSKTSGQHSEISAIPRPIGKRAAPKASDILSQAKRAMTKPRTDRNVGQPSKGRQSAQAPKAIMSAEPEQVEPMTKGVKTRVNSNTSRPRPKHDNKAVLPSQKPVHSIVKKSKPVPLEEEVDWFEHLQTEESDNLGWAQSKAKKSVKSKTTKSSKPKPTISKAATQKRDIRNPPPRKSKRAAAMKATAKIRGAVDNDSNTRGSSPPPLDESAEESTKHELQAPDISLLSDSNAVEVSYPIAAPPGNDVKTDTLPITKAASADPSHLPVKVRSTAGQAKALKPTALRYETEKVPTKPADKVHDQPLQKSNAVIDKIEGGRMSPAPTNSHLTAKKLQDALAQFSDVGRQRQEKRVTTEAKKSTIMNPPNSTITYQFPQVGKPDPKSKRHIEASEIRHNKKNKSAVWKPYVDPVAGDMTMETPKAKEPAIDRKPRLIHFDSTGPRNQGVSSSKKVEAPRTIQPRSSLVASYIRKAALGNSMATPDPRRAIQKRKFSSPASDMPIVSGREPTDKRRKLIESISSRSPDQDTGLDTQQDFEERPMVQSFEWVPKHVSQGSRVDEYGSPLPFQHTRLARQVNKGTTLSTGNLPDPSRHTTGVDDFFATTATEHTAQIDPISLPLPQQMNALPTVEPKTLVANNTKHRPSSPNAPSSVIGDMTAHKLQPSGHFIEVRTNDIVVPRKPQDPFTEVSYERSSNKFMDLLRKSCQDKAQENKGNGNKQDVDRIAPSNGVISDPDKTLIGEQLPEEREYSTASESSSSRSSRSQGAPDDEPSDNSSDDGTAWAQALRGDQRDTLETLYEISHVGIHHMNICNIANSKASV